MQLAASSNTAPKAGPAVEFQHLEPMILDVGDIQLYEHNPRQAPHAEYGRIKASIRADGLEQPLVVTRRPGEADYRLHAGGNTRLKILKELYAETGETRFARVACWYRAWTDEADVVLAHLKENDLRGDLTFIDKALAVCNAERWLAAGSSRKLTQARLAEALAGRGYALSQGLISQMKYAVGRLRAAMPEALEAGLGRRQVMRIRSLDRVAKSLWLERTVDAEAEYDEVFGALCRRYDTPEWAIENLRRALEAEIAERAEVSIQAVSLDIDAGLAGRPFAAAAGVDGDNEDDGCEATNKPPARDRAKRRGVANRANGAGPRNEKRESAEADPAAAVHDLSVSTANGARSPEHIGVASAIEADGESANGAAHRASAKLPESLDIESIRETLWTLADGLARRNGLDGLIRRLRGRGTGYVVCDVPDAGLAEQLEEAELAQVSLVWWHLAACAEITVAPPDALLGELAPDSMLRRALTERDSQRLFDRVWTLDPGQAGHGLWRTASDRDWRDLLALMCAYRALHRCAAVNNADLWGGA